MLTMIDDLKDAVDVACGRSNYTSAFCRLVNRYKNEYAEFKDEKAKAHVDSYFAHQRKYRGFRRMAKGRQLKEIIRHFNALRRSYGLGENGLCPHSSNQISNCARSSDKKAFGVVETDELKQLRIDTAMTGKCSTQNYRLGVYSKDERIAQLFPKIFELAVMNSFAISNSVFESFADDLKNVWINSTSISHREIVPGIESLYVQYNALNNIEEKDCLVRRCLITHISLIAQYTFRH
ncbi:hypothetical protein PRIPAC_89406 [Pristionchus pacificus]|uniref:Uncharacterized protein n=1 Tax=Pristionchus pacificus TaxID=54126 RepID=A0A2A6CW94_PRIPA|nr:hypothetical protein PRIPAC_89406 [Pristionchus pacificus]|eukprot:PDM82429.1 hypothetical protein PRIPAC_36822 [Pristionchus pacificus]